MTTSFDKELMQKNGLTSEGIRATYTCKSVRVGNYCVRADSPIISYMVWDNDTWRDVLGQAPWTCGCGCGSDYTAYVILPTHVVDDVQKTLDAILDGP